MSFPGWPRLHIPRPVLSLKGELSPGWGAHSSDPTVSLLKGVEHRGKERPRRVIKIAHER